MGTKSAAGQKEKCASTGQVREDRAVGTSASFEPLSLEIKYPDTAILLLRSAERPILLAAASAIARFAEKSRGNLEALFDLNIVDTVLPMIEHEDVFTRRFALKLLALMSAVQNVQTHLLKDDKYIVFFTEMFINEADIFLQEFASRIVAELSSDPTGSAMLLDKYSDASFLFGKMQATDPDIKRNSIEIIHNMLKDFNGLDAVFHSLDFSFGPIYELLSQPYPIIQELALDVVERIVLHNGDEDAQESFRQSGGVHYLLDILDSEEWSDLFSKVLHILDLSCDNSKTAELMNIADGTKRLFSFMERTQDAKMKFQALRILVNLAESLIGKQVLHSVGLVKHLYNYLEASLETDAHAVLCTGFGKMTQYNQAASEISLENPINFVLSLLDNNEAKWSERQAAAFALKELLASDYQNCINFLDFGGQVHLMRFIESPVMGDVPWEIQITVVEAISAIADYSPLAQDLIDYDLFAALCSHFDAVYGASDELKIACCNALARFPVNEDGRKVLVHVYCLKKLYSLIQDSESMPVRSAATQLILQLSCDPLLANLCAQEGYLAYMLKNRSMSRNMKTWNRCIEALFNADMPMKFAYTGRLSLHDVTLDGFYVLRRSSCPFLLLDELFRLKLCPLEPIYVANFSGHRNTEADDYLASKQAAFEAARETMRRESMEKGLRVSEATINAWLELRFGRLQTDSNLISYLEMFKAELDAIERSEERTSSKASTTRGLAEVAKIALRACLLAKFVARQMSGTDATGTICIPEQLELHLRAIKDSIETSVIPLGMLRVGSYLERAMLFKVMADQIGLPAAFARGRYGRSWVEICVPTMEGPKDTGHEIPSQRYGAILPTKYMRENFIVDLMDTPGDLIPMDSPRGRLYCDKQLSYDFACCR